MTIEKMNKAKDIQSQIVYKKEQLRLIEKSKEYKSSNRVLGVQNTAGFNIVIPKSIEQTLYLLIEAEYKTQVQNLEKEFEEL